MSSLISFFNHSDAKIIKKINEAGIKIFWSHTIVDTRGYKRLSNVSIMKLSNDGTSVTGSKISISCDCLGIAGGWTPAVHLYTQSGSKLTFDEERKIFIPKADTKEQISVGSFGGDFELDEIITNLNYKLKNFLNINKTDFEGITLENDHETSKRNIWLLPSDQSLSLIHI